MPRGISSESLVDHGPCQTAHHTSEKQMREDLNYKIYYN